MEQSDGISLAIKRVMNRLYNVQCMSYIHGLIVVFAGSGLPFLALVNVCRLLNGACFSNPIQYSAGRYIASYGAHVTSLLSKYILTCSVIQHRQV